MALHITNAEVEQQVRNLASAAGESITEVIGNSVTERASRLGRRAQTKPCVEEIMALVRSYNLKPINAALTEDAILGYGTLMEFLSSDYRLFRFAGHHL